MHNFALLYRRGGVWWWAIGGLHIAYWYQMEFVYNVGFLKNNECRILKQLIYNEQKFVLVI